MHSFPITQQSAALWNQFERAETRRWFHRSQIARPQDIRHKAYEAQKQMN
jgi:hypothetical protein